MSPSIAESILVAAPAAAVMDVIADFSAYPDWQEDVRAVEILDVDDSGWARRVRFVVDAKVFRAEYVLAYDYTATSMSWRLVGSGQLETLSGSYVLSATRAGTSVRYQLEVVPRVPVPAPLRRLAARRIVTTALEGLKRRVETRR